MTRLLPLLLLGIACREAATPAPPSEPPPASEATGDRRLLDLDAVGRRLTGVFRAAPAHADPLPLLAPFLDGRPLPWGDVLDARFVPGHPERFVVVDGQGGLSIRDAANRTVRALDVDVDAGVSVNARCGCVAYMSGPPYERAVKVVVLDEGAPRVVAADVAPAWLPVLAPDGRSIAFASGRSGFASLWTVGTDGTGLAQRTNVGANAVDGLTPVPEGPEPPTWDGTTLRFVNADGRHAIPLEPGNPLPVRPGAIRGTP